MSRDGHTAVTALPFASPATAHARGVGRREIEEWLILHLAGILHVEPRSVDPGCAFADYGIDSLAAVMLSGDLEEFLGRRLSPTLAWDYPTVESLARHLAEESHG